MKFIINNVFKLFTGIAIFSFISFCSLAVTEAAVSSTQSVNFMISRLELPKDQEAVTGFFQNGIDKNIILKNMTVTLTVYDSSNNVIRKNSKTLKLPDIYLLASGKSDIYKFNLDDPGNKAHTGSVTTTLTAQVRWIVQK